MTGGAEVLTAEPIHQHDPGHDGAARGLPDPGCGEHAGAVREFAESAGGTAERHHFDDGGAWQHEPAGAELRSASGGPAVGAAWAGGTVGALAA